MNSFELYICPSEGMPNRIRFSGPSSWKELTDSQSVALMRVRAQADNHREVLFAAITLLYGVKPGLQRWLFDERFLYHQGFSNDDRVAFLEHGQNILKTLDWIGQEDKEATFPTSFRRFDFHYGSPRILVKRLLNRTEYVGPTDGLSNCTFEVFMAADKAYRDGQLARLAAILYRPQEEVGQPLDQYGVDQRAIQFKALDPALLDRIGFAFGCTMLLLQRYFTHVFPKKLTSDEETNQNSRKTSKGTWLDVAIGMAKLDVTKISQIESQNLYLVLKVLDEQLKQAEAMEREIEKMKNR